jgi:DeoR/GlpR family transcriptional regulator of sugar metabolism
MDQATMKQAMIEVSAEVILLADHSKFGHVSSSIVGPITMIDYLITDNGISDEFNESLVECGIQVIKVETLI